MKTLAFLTSAVCGWLVFAGPATAVNCPASSQTVCAASNDGHRSNITGACFAQQKGYRVLHQGRCEAPDEPSACPHLMSPVCATDPVSGKERSYPNSCTAEVATAAFIHTGSCLANRPPG